MNIIAICYYIIEIFAIAFDSIFDPSPLSNSLETPTSEKMHELSPALACYVVKVDRASLILVQADLYICRIRLKLVSSCSIK